MDSALRPRPLEQICRNFSDHIFTVDASRFLDGNDDLIVCTDGIIAGTFFWTILVNPQTGHFIVSRTGTETRRQMKTEKNVELTGTPWYDELMRMIYCQREEEGVAK